MSILSTGDVERINEASLRVLWETGVQVDDDAVVALLRERGCSVVEGTRVVRFPREVVEAALAACPREVKLAGLGGDQTVVRAGGPSVFWTGNAINLAVDKHVEPIDTGRFVDLVHVVDGLGWSTSTAWSARASTTYPRPCAVWWACDSSRRTASSTCAPASTTPARPRA